MDRIYKIAEILLDSKKPATVSEIAKKLMVSNKTVRNDFKKLEELVNESGLKLCKKTGVGTTIEGSEEKKLYLLDMIKKSTNYIEPYSPEDRQNYILKRLFMTKSNVTIQEIAEELYVSRVTIHKDLQNVEKWLNGFDLKLFRKTNHGIEIIGDEEHWREAIASLISINKHNDELMELFYNDYNGRIDYKSLIKLKELVDIDYKHLEKIVKKTEEKLDYRFSDEAFISLIIHIAISIKRLKEEKDISLPNETLQNLKSREEFILAEEMATDIQKSFDVKLPESEVGYILLHILGSKLQHNEDEELIVGFEDGDDNDLSAEMAKEIIDIAEKSLSLKLSQDKQFFYGLCLHLRPTINRLKYNLTLRNPMLTEIKENYPDIFGVAWITSVVFEKYLGIKIDEEEIGYIALHIGAAVERNKNSLRALIVCHSGIGTSQILLARLKKSFRYLDIKGVLSSIAIKNNSLDDIDIIISTVPLEEVEKPVLVVKPLLTQKDIKRLNNFINIINQGKTQYSS